MKTAAYVLNQVPSKSVPNTLFELWSQKKPSLRHFHVWGCKAEVRPYNPQSKKLDPKTISGYSVGYCVGSRGSRFYCPSHTIRIIKSDRAIYFEDDNGISQGPREIVFKEHPVIVPVPGASAPVSDSAVDQYPVTIHEEPVK